MFLTALIPFIFSLGFYYQISRTNPLKLVNSNLTLEILKTFKIEYLVLLPIGVILALSLRKISIQYSMLLSVVAASVIAVVIQGYSPLQVLTNILFGFHLNSESLLRNIIGGGGVVSMLRACSAVLIDHLESW